MSQRSHRDYLITVEDDGLLTREVGSWVEQKYRYVGMYAQLFSTGMKNRWKRRVYLDLFSGPGHSRIRGTTRVVLGSPLLALDLADPFDAYIFGDDDSRAANALRTRVARTPYHDRVSFVIGDANEKAGEIIERIPGADGQQGLSFCFLDPDNLDIRFETVRTLATGRNIDFLILLALYVDANRNVQSYLRPESKTIERFLGDPSWRDAWKAAASRGQDIVQFLADAYSRSMVSIGFLPMTLEEMVKVRSDDKQLPLYYLAFFSRNRTGLKFWREVRKYATDQLSLF